MKKDYIHGPKIDAGLDIYGPKIDFPSFDIHGPKRDAGLNIH